MKKFIVSALMAAGLMFSAVSAQAQTQAVGIVDVNLIMTEAVAAKSLAKQIKEQGDAAQAEFSKFERELKDMETALNKARADKVTEEEFNKKRTAFEKKLADTQTLFQKRRGDFEKNKADAFKTLSEAILKETDKIAAEKKLDLVLAKNVVILSSKQMDITQAVLDGVNKSLKDVKLKASTN